MTNPIQQRDDLKDKLIAILGEPSEAQVTMKVKVVWSWKHGRAELDVVVWDGGDIDVFVDDQSDVGIYADLNPHQCLALAKDYITPEGEES